MASRDPGRDRGGYDRGGRSGGEGRGGGRGGGGRGGGFDRGGRGGGGGRGGPPSPEVLYNPGPLEKPSPNVHERENGIIASQNDLSVKQLSISNSNLPQRPGYGTLGLPIILRTNYFHLLPKPEKKLFKYAVEIDPKEQAARKKRRILTLFLQIPQIRALGYGVATDYSSSIVTSVELDLGKDGRREFKIDYYDKEDVLPGQAFQPDPAHPPKRYTIKIQSTGRVDIPELLEYLDSTPANQNSGWDAKSETIQALNIIMARNPNFNENVVISSGNKFYDFPVKPPEERDNNGKLVLENSLGGGLFALKGFYSSVRTSTLRVLLNVNVCTSAFYPAIGLLDLIHLRVGRVDRLTEADYRKLEVFLKKLRVSTNHVKKDGARLTFVKTIRGLARHPTVRQQLAVQQHKTYANAGDIKFRYRNKDVTVAEYYLKQHQIKLRRPDIALIDVGTAEKSTFLPVELCNVLPGQMYKTKLSEDETAQMIRYAVKKPKENASLIVETGLRVVGIPRNTKDPVHDAFGLKIEAKMLTVNGRILAPPKVIYANKKIAETQNGSWNMKNIQFSEPVAVTLWSYVRFNVGYRRDDHLFRDDIAVFQKTLGECGLGISAPVKFPNHYVELNGKTEVEIHVAVRNFLSNVVSQSPTKILLIILPNANAITYARIKYFADVVYGKSSVHTVCVVGNDRKFYNKMGSAQSLYCANVALKFNLKNGGVNQSLPDDKLGILRDGKTMVVGIDVTHPSPGSIEGVPSIAGVVASIDKKYAQWPASIRPNPSRKEMVDNLDQMIIERLHLWSKKNNGTLPNKVLVYRDGVSEGQYETVLSEELPAFQKAFEKLYGKKPHPKISIIIVGKRHHTRFYPTSTDDCDVKGNPKNGTVVDRGITMERGWDFFLQAHTCIQGTARPAHYIVIRDEIGLGADGLEQLTHNLCYLFGRATKAVSICPPAYYADLLCERGRCYLQKDLAPADGASVASGEPFSWAKSNWRPEGGVHGKLKDSMFYI